MTFSGLLKKLRDEQKINAGQADILLDLYERRIIPVHRELRFFLYFGILLIVAGTGLTIKQYFVHLGDIAIIASLSLCCTAAFVYCFWKGSPFRFGEVPSPNIAFDYILFLGCALFSMDIAYIEMQFHILSEGWKNYLLISFVLFIILAYRFDNRLVLSLALSTLAAWFGFSLASWRLFSFAEYYRFYAMIYALILLGMGILSSRMALKKHFFDIYFNFAAHFLCVALIAGVAEYKLFSLYFPALLIVCIGLAFYSVRVRRFLYMLYAVIYGYVGLSIVVVDRIHRETFLIFAYFIVTSGLVIYFILKMSRQSREEQ
jgi:hypothetical protein